MQVQLQFATLWLNELSIVCLLILNFKLFRGYFCDVNYNNNNYYYYNYYAIYKAPSVDKHELERCDGTEPS